MSTENKSFAPYLQGYCRAGICIQNHITYELKIDLMWILADKQKIRQKMIERIDISILPQDHKNQGDQLWEK